MVRWCSTELKISPLTFIILYNDLPSAVQSSEDNSDSVSMFMDNTTMSEVINVPILNGKFFVIILNVIWTMWYSLRIMEICKLILLKMQGNANRFSKEQTVIPPTSGVAREI